MAEQDTESVREMAEHDAETPEEELFPLGTLEGDDVTLGGLVKGNHSFQITVSMNGTSEIHSPSDTGLFDPSKEHMLLVTCEQASLELVPDREGERVQGKKIVGWKGRQKLRPIYCEKVKGEAGVIESQFSALLGADEAAAMALLDRLKARAEKALGVTA